MRSAQSWGCSPSLLRHLHRPLRNFDGRWSGPARFGSYWYIDVKNGQIVGGMVKDACCMSGVVSPNGDLQGVILIGASPRRAIDITGNLTGTLRAEFSDASGHGRAWIDLLTPKK